eukprot:TRINITY_DN61607_c0_g1_i2.p1 TRINITY_DN61607_c0_g1~~TRINITY_DN61607_c0_g1_i2.p1  ORF type:complete len:124 (+),score=8.23 TRINITY_DN61607_c0_g1_i2:177-548(+)
MPHFPFLHHQKAKAESSPTYNNTTNGAPINNIVYNTINHINMAGAGGSSSSTTDHSLDIGPRKPANQIKPLQLNDVKRVPGQNGPVTTPARLPILTDNTATANSLFPPIKTDRTPASSYQNLL